MTPRPRIVGLAVMAAALLVVMVAGPARANVQIPGLNGRIAFTSERDFPFDLDTRGLQCFSGRSCSDEIYSMNPNGSDQTRLTNNTFYDDEAAWLPADGANIAFESERDSCSDGCFDSLYSMTSLGGSPLRLTNQPGDSYHPSYSPDGTKIAYTHNDRVQNSASRGVPGVEQIMIVPSGGDTLGAPVPLLPPDQTGPLSNGEREDFFPAWSPDGTKIAFTRLTETITPDEVTPPDSRGTVITSGTFTIDLRTFVAPAAGGGPATPIETYPACSVHFSNNTFAAELSSDLADAASSPDPRAVHRVLSTRLKGPNCIGDEKPAWSPDGSKIAVERFFTGSPPPPPVLTSGTRGGIFAGFDPGDIAVFNSSDGSGDVNLSDLSEPSDCNTTEGTPRCSQDQYPSWSPDGSMIAFHSDRQADGSASNGDCTDPTTGEPNGACDDEIWTMHADGSGLAQLTNNNVDDFDPDWQRIPPTATPPAAVPAKAPVAPKVGVAGVRRACVSSSFHVRFRIATTASTVKSVVVKLDGKRIKRTTKGSFTLTINSKKLEAGRHRLTITATDSTGHATTTHKTFSVCKAAKPRRKAAPRFTG